MKIIVQWSHWNGLFGEEEYLSQSEADEAIRQLERDGCKVSVEVRQL